ncbi:MAG: phosphatidylethanolamine N-methyltransferase family protein [Alphaproteobacteria bacterium]|nr:phosphatidylethanolamine N-methyltransferase family protein [Alphaproteobacteria bacterium]
MEAQDRKTNWPLVFEGQLTHAACLAALLAVAIWAAGRGNAMDGAFLGMSTLVWFVLLLADAIVHQIFVWIAWRLELHGKLLTRWFGDTERAFRFYAVLFAVLFAARFVIVTVLAVANRGTLDLAPWLGLLIAAIIAVPAAYLFYSVKTYFSFRRAFGIDHFDPEARTWPMVREGIFRFTSNGMYVFGIGALWIPALALQSQAALIGAAFSHAYIWVHYFTVEKPDMRRIYATVSHERS